MRNRRGVGNGKRLLAGWLCVVLFLVSIMPTGLQVRAAEVGMERGNEQSAVDEAQGEDVVDGADGDNASESDGENGESGNENDNSGSKNEGDEQGNDYKEDGEDKVGDKAGDKNGDAGEGNAGEDAGDVDNGEDNIVDGEFLDQVIEGSSDGKEADLDELLSVNVEERLVLMSSEGDIASGISNDIVWVIDGNGKLTVTGTGDFTELGNDDLNHKKMPWYDYSKDIKSAKVKVSGMKDASDMFYDCSNIVSLDVSEFDTSNVTDMTAMFLGCSNLKYLDVSKFDTSNVIGMVFMFSGCSSLTNLDVSKFDTNSVTGMGGMFLECSSLRNLNVSGFDTANVTDMGHMFSGCDSLTSLNVSDFDTRNVTHMDWMFSNCGNLCELNVSGFDTRNVTDIGRMFSGCSNLRNLNISRFDTSSVTDMGWMFYGCNNLLNIDVSGFDTSNVINMEGMFRGCSSLTNLDVSRFDTGNVTNMYDMFCDCNNLANLDVSGFDTSNVTKMAGMFMNCSNLSHLDVGGFDTRNVTSMQDMFCGCRNLTNLDVSGFDTGRVTDISWMFYSCSSLIKLDVNSFEISNVTSMEWMFGWCNNLTDLDLSNYNAINVLEAENMLLFNSNLTTVYTPYNLNVSVKLPTNSGDTWYRSDGTVVTELPKNLSYSVALGKNYIPKERVEEIEGITIGSKELISNINVPKDKSVLYIMDGKTEEPIEQARIWINGEHYTGADGIVQLDQEGLTTIQIEKEGYHKKTVKKRLRKGMSTTVLLSPKTGDLQILSASLNLSGEDEDVLETITYLTHKELTQVANGIDATFTLTAEASGNPQRYQLIQNGKVLEENTTGIFELKGKYSNGKDGTVTYYIDELAAGYMVSVRVFGTGGNGESNQTHRQELGIRVSEATSGSVKIKEIGSDGKVELGDKLTVTLPDQIPILGGSSLDFGFENELPVKITVDNSGLVKVALNMGSFDTADSAAWYDKKQEFDSLARRAEALWNSGAAFGGKPQSFGAGMFSVEGNIVGYGEGYWDERSDSLCITVNVIANVKAEKKYTKYCFLPLIVPIPVYITFGGGVSLKAAQGIDFALSGDGLLVNGGTCEIEPSIYVTPEAGVGADGVLSLGAYGRISLDWLHRFIDRYDRVSLDGSAKIKATALFWKKEWNLCDGSWVIYDSNKRSVNQASVLSELNINYMDMSGADIISMDYLAKRGAEGTGTSALSSYAVTGGETNNSTRILNYAYENASPRLLQSEDNLYLFYLDGVDSREVQNQTALFYRISIDQGATWSEAMRVDGGANETADYNYDVALDGNNIYAIWSDAGKVYGDELAIMDSTAAINQISKEMNLMLAIINRSTGEIETCTIDTEDADLQPQIAVETKGVVHVAWIANDVSADGGLLSNENQISICYASSEDGYTVHRLPISDGFYPLTLDIGQLDSEIYIISDMDTDGDLNTQNDREIYTINPKTGEKLSAMTINQVTDSVPTFGEISGKGCLFWYQGGNIVYTMDGQNIVKVFDDEALPLMGQEFSVLQGSDGRASIIWTTTSQTENAGVDVYCSDYNGSSWSGAYRLGALDGEYTTVLSGYLAGDTHRMVYLGSRYAGEELNSHISMYIPGKQIDTSITWNAEEEGKQGEEYPIHLTIENIGNTEVDTITITSETGTISDTITGLFIAPGSTQEIVWNGIRLPEEMTEVYSSNLTVAAEGETDIANNTFALSIGAPDFSIEAYSDYSSGESLAGVIVSNNGILSSDAVLTVYRDAGHVEELYRTDMTNVSQEESKITVFDLTAMDETAETFYFSVSDRNGIEQYIDDNETLLYVGKGAYLEYSETERPTIEYITVEKVQTSYEYGDVLYTDDLTVMLHYSDGSTKGTIGYSTDADTVDMYSLGEKVLTVSCNGMTATVVITVEPRTLDEETAVLLSYSSCRYDGSEKEPIPVSVSVGGARLVMGMDYTVSYENNINVGEAAVYITGQNYYQGTVMCNFSIIKGVAPRDRKATVYTACGQADVRKTVDISGQYAGYGVITGYEIHCTEDDNISGDILLETPMMEDGTLIYRTNAGAAGDFATITVEVAFQNYENARIDIFVMMTAKEPVVISGINIPDSTYTGEEASWSGRFSVTSADGRDVTDQVTLVYSYSGIQADGEEYRDSKPPVNVGEYTLTIAVSEEEKIYIGERNFDFRITSAKVVIAAENVTLVVGEPIPTDYRYQVTGLLNGDKLLKEPSFICDVIDSEKTGAYPIIPSDADAGMNYRIIYRRGTLTVAREKVAYTVTFNLAGHGTDIAPITGVEAGSLINAPRQLKADGYVFAGWYQDEKYTKAWNFDENIVQEDVTLYACWLISGTVDIEGVNLSVQEIKNQFYTGSALKPTVYVYSGDGATLLKAGKDYTIKYFNNIEADKPDEIKLGGISATGEESGEENGFTKQLAYVIITGKGNYTGTLYRNFHIDPVSISDDSDGTQKLVAGFTMKYTEQMVENNRKSQKPFGSMKYKKNMKAGRDYEVKLTALMAYDTEDNLLSKGSRIDESSAGSILPTIPAGYRGTFRMSVTGIGNYTGTVSRTIYVTDKNQLIKNTVITLGKNQKSMKYTGKAIGLTPAYYDTVEKKYYAVNEDGTVNREAILDKKDVFSVRAGKEYLCYGRDYLISYTNNLAVGTATMTITGIGDYMGSKSVIFKITGAAFNAKSIRVENMQTSMSYTGKALTQNAVVLMDIKNLQQDGTGKMLVYGTDYTISYKNNLKKGTATMTFTAKPISGYSGSFKKTFKIMAQNLPEAVKVMARDSAKDRIVYGSEDIRLIGEIAYRREGVKPSDRIYLINQQTGIVLKEGVDYTVNYTDNKAVTTDNTRKLPAMNIKGKGNYTGILQVNFQIGEAPMEENENLTVTAVASAYNVNRVDTYKYQPRIRVMDGKKVLSAKSDYTVAYENCTQADVRAWLTALENNAGKEELEKRKPRAVVTARSGSGYQGSIIADLPIYQTKLTTNTLYIVISEEAVDITYTGKQIRPKTEVYYGSAGTVRAARKAKETNESILTDQTGIYKLRKLSQQTAEKENGDYVLSYGANVAAGKNKGSVTITGVGLYGGNVTAKFRIMSRNVYSSIARYSIYNMSAVTPEKYFFSSRAFLPS